MPTLSFKAQFVDKIERRKKTQTIRNYRKHPIQAGDHLYLYYAQRSKWCRKIGEAECLSVSSITITADSIQIGLVGQIRTDAEWLNNFSKADGFKSWEEMKSFWIDNHGPDCFPFRGVLIRWKLFSKKEWIAGKPSHNMISIEQDQYESMVTPNMTSNNQSKQSHAKP